MSINKQIVEPTWEGKYSFSPAVVTEGGKVAWLAGHVGFMDNDHQSLAGDFEAQVHQTFTNIKNTMEKVGGTLEDIVYMSVVVSDPRFSQVFTDIRKEYYPDKYPASTLVTVASFAHPDIMVEVTPIAVLPMS